ncbi:hypothetical protein [Cellulomonas sp. URHD0024]|uniref:hypothetical protein n=1 Tax=Cellulomonas sp. URHD0024 TaxID=1302620 RepID=UPI0004024008|nr:hypothetical protein [Cellulomonas sp. URHD0024]
MSRSGWVTFRSTTALDTVGTGEVTVVRVGPPSADGVREAADAHARALLAGAHTVADVSVATVGDHAGLCRELSGDGAGTAYYWAQPDGIFVAVGTAQDSSPMAALLAAAPASVVLTVDELGAACAALGLPLPAGVAAPWWADESSSVQQRAVSAALASLDVRGVAVTGALAARLRALSSADHAVFLTIDDADGARAALLAGVDGDWVELAHAGPGAVRVASIGSDVAGGLLGALPRGSSQASDDVTRTTTVEKVRADLADGSVTALVSVRVARAARGVLEADEVTWTVSALGATHRLWTEGTELRQSSVSAATLDGALAELTSDARTDRRVS